MIILKDLIEQYVALPGMSLEQIAEHLSAIGLEVASVQGPGGVLEVEVTPNRPDWLSHVGVARDLFAQIPEARLLTPEGVLVPLIPSTDEAPVSIRDAGCSHYELCALQGLTARPSLEKHQDVLTRLGLNPRNSLVDMSNLALHLLGHPIHVFDADQVVLPLEIRSARNGEHLMLLDGRDVDLVEKDLVIADQRGPVALAGVMGGAESAVSDGTTRVLIESAWFDPVRVRLTARRLGISTDASYRFERGADPGATRKAVELYVRLLNDDGQKPECCGLWIVGEAPTRAVVLNWNPDDVRRLSGLEVPLEQVEAFLTRMGFSVRKDGALWQVTVPSWRFDVSLSCDLVEEVVRLYGYNRLASELPQTSHCHQEDDHVTRFISEASGYLVHQGFSQTLSYVFHGREADDWFEGPGSDPVNLKNPLGKEYGTLRSHLLVGLLRAAAHNRNHGQNGIKLFEQGHVFGWRDGKIVEQNAMGILVSGRFSEPWWGEKDPSTATILHLKGWVEALFAHVGLKTEWIPAGRIPGLVEGALRLRVNGFCCGYAGQVAGDVLAAAGGLEGPVLVAQIPLLPEILKVRLPRFEMWSRYPSVARDLTLVTRSGVTWSSVADAVRELAPVLLENIKLVDLYEGERLGPDQKAWTLGMTYRSQEHTLTAEEVNEVHGVLVMALCERLHAAQR